MNSKNTFLKILSLTLIAMISIGLFVSCSDDDNDNSTDMDTDPNLLEVIQDDSDFSTLAGIIEDLGLSDALANQQLTVFAPTNAALEAVSDVIPTLSDDDLTQIVQYHLTEGAVLSTDLEASQDVEMVQGEVTLIEATGSGVLINGSSQVVKADLEATNGVVHGIDQILLPDEYRVALQGPSLVEVAEQAGNFTTLLSLVESAGLTTTLKYKGPFTAFPPTDAAFTELGEQVDLGAITSDTELVANILMYHLLSGEVLSTDLEAEQMVPSLTEEPLYITANGGVTVNGTANVTSADITDPTNGVIHVVDTVLLPNALQNIPGLVTKNYNLSTLLDLVAARPDVLDLLGDESASFTVFAPNNQAFEGALAENPGLTEEQVSTILGYHLLATEVLSTDLEEQQAVETVGGENIYVTVADGTVTINNSATVTMADMTGSNGTVHVIDGVLLPNAFTPVTGIVSKNYNLSTLLSLVAEREAILNTLSDEESEFTIFTPTNAAFEAALEAYPDLTEEQITEILTYHVLTSAVLSSELSDGQTVETFQGEEITVSVGDDGVQINNATVTTVDLEGTNGIVHIIDSVLLPPSYTE